MTPLPEVLKPNAKATKRTLEDNEDDENAAGPLKLFF